MEDEELIHYGIKGMRWGSRNNTSGGGWSTGAPAAKPKSASASAAKPKSASAPAAKPKPKPGTSTTSAKSKVSAAKSKVSAATASAPKASPTRSFRDTDGVRSKKQSQMTPAEKAHRKKMILGGVAVVGVLGIVAAGVTVHKVSPQAIGAFGKLSTASQNKVAGVLAHPKAANLKLQGNRKVNAVKMNALFKQAELAERTSKSPLGSIARQRSIQFKANPTVARAGISQSLGELRRDTEQMKAMNDAEKYIGDMVKNRSNTRFAREAQKLTTSNDRTQALKKARDITDARRTLNTNERTQALKKAKETAATWKTLSAKDRERAFKKANATARRSAGL